MPIGSFYTTNSGFCGDIKQPLSYFDLMCPILANMNEFVCVSFRFILATHLHYFLSYAYYVYTS